MSIMDITTLHYAQSKRLFKKAFWLGLIIIMPFINLMAQTTDDFVITIETTSDNESFTIPTTGSGYDYNVDWENDGTVDTTGVNGDISHTYPSAGKYSIRIMRNDGGAEGTSWNGFPRIYFNDTGDKDKILSVNQWGTGAWESMEKAFYGCSNLNSASVMGGTGEPDWATDAPDLSNVESMSEMFHGALIFNQPVNHWNTENITNMRAVFRLCEPFNQPLDNWNTDNVTTLYEMFYGDTVFNQDIGGWNTENVTTMSAMFYYASAFNQDIGSWNTAEVTDMKGMFWGASSFNQDIGSWDIGKVNRIYAMFADAVSFNQDISGWDITSVNGPYMLGWMFWQATSFNQDISSWNTSNITIMTDMFAGATSFDQDLSGFDMSSVTDADEMLDSTALSVSNYDNTLIGWDAQDLQSDVILGAAGLKYCLADSARTHMINTDNWTINGDSKECNSSLPIELLSFDLFAKEDVNQLIWKTAAETNINMFVIERMNPQNKKITQIGTVKASGDSHAILSYEFNDTKPLHDAYYRIRIMQYSGISRYSGWLHVTRRNSGLELTALYPNPAKDMVNIEIFNGSCKTVSIDVRDLTGKILLKKSFNTNLDIQKIKLNLGDISAGTYLIVIENDNDRIIKLLVKE